MEKRLFFYVISSAQIWIDFVYSLSRLLADSQTVIARTRLKITNDKTNLVLFTGQAMKIIVFFKINSNCNGNHQSQLYPTIILSMKQMSIKCMKIHKMIQNKTNYKLFLCRFLDDFWQTWPLFVSLKRGYYYFSSVSYRMHAKEILRTCKSTRVNNTAQSKWKSRHTEIFFSFQFVCCLMAPLIWKKCKIKQGPVNLKYLPLNVWIISMPPAFLNNKVEYKTNTIFIYILDSKNINFSSSKFWSENQKALGFFKDADPLAKMCHQKGAIWPFSWWTARRG